MTARERILMIRLIEKLGKHPAYAKALGVEAPGAQDDQNQNPNHKGLTVA